MNTNPGFEGIGPNFAPQTSDLAAAMVKASVGVSEIDRELQDARLALKALDEAVTSLIARLASASASTKRVAFGQNQLTGSMSPNDFIYSALGTRLRDLRLTANATAKRVREAEEDLKL